MSVAERFWAKVNKRGEAECWLWTGAKHGPMTYGYYALSRLSSLRQATHK